MFHCLLIIYLFVNDKNTTIINMYIGINDFVLFMIIQGIIHIYQEDIKNMPLIKYLYYILNII
jgi:hypothetical protein